MLRKLLCLLLLFMFSFTLCEAESSFPLYPDINDSNVLYPASSDPSVILTRSVDQLTLSCESAEADRSLFLDLNLNAGTLYQISFSVYQDQSDKVTFSATAVSVKEDGSEQIDNSRTTGVPRGEWTEVFTVFNPSAHERCYVKLAPVDSDLTSYSIRDVSVDYRNRTYAMDIPSLKEFFAEDFLFGTAISRSEAADTMRMSFYSSQFNIFTAGNEMKPDSLLDIPACQKLVEETGDETAVAIKLDNARPLLDFCRRTGNAVHGHTLLWHEQTPPSLFSLGYRTKNGNADREIMLGRMENYIKTVMEAVEA